MTPYYADESVTLHLGDCIEVMAELPDASVDAVVCDPPYGLGFMGKAWDDLPPGLPWAQECLRVLKPGGHLLAFGGTRTWHRLAVAVEDAGFEMRDSIAWLHGQGFPKGKGQLKPAFEPVVVARKAGPIWLNIAGCRVPGVVPSVPQPDFRHVNGVTTHLDAHKRNGEMSAAPGGRWPTNVLLDGSQADALDEQSGTLTSGSRQAGVYRGLGYMGSEATDYPAVEGDQGGASRFFPTFRYEAKAPTAERPRVRVEGGTGRVAGTPARTGRECNVCGNRTVPPGGSPWPACGHEDWSPFTTEDKSADYVAHPTVKPLDLMRWLVRLVTPPGGTVLEPFAGSGTTAEACVIEGFRCIAIEREAAYLPLIVARLSKPIQPDLFGGAA